MDAETLLAELPRTECRQCGFPGCGPYAAAMSEGRAGPDDCTPGGAWVRDRLRTLLGLPREPATHVLAAPFPTPRRARIDAEWCIGCAKCLDACPVDAIIGAAHQLHGIVATVCTGCGLCVPPCPVDCIELIPLAGPAMDVAASVRTPEQAPCIPCEQCAPVCPETLDPARLLRDLSSLDFSGARAASLLKCTECGKCDEVCPSRIPLSATFKTAKAVLASTDAARAAAQQAAARVTARDRRLARASAQPHVVAEMPDLATISGAPASREIAAAVARARTTAAAPRASREP